MSVEGATAARVAYLAWRNRDKVIRLIIYVLLVLGGLLVLIFGLIQAPLAARAGIPPDLMAIYQAAEAKFGIPWQYLAAINKVETDFGRNMGTYRVLDVLEADQMASFEAICAEVGLDSAVVMGSSSGAIGFMQFMPNTWQKYKMASENLPYDPWDPEDSIFAAAYLLASNGGTIDIRAALYSYNHSDAYVNQVMELAEIYAGLGLEVLPGSPNALGYTYPVGGNPTYMDFFGSPRDGGTRLHMGVDIAVPVGTPLYACFDGIISFVGDYGRGGNTIILSGYDGRVYTYCHLGVYAVGMAEGVEVSSGEIIGYVGMTGVTSGPHLHFMIEENGVYVDPLPYLLAWGG